MKIFKNKKNFKRIHLELFIIKCNKKKPESIITHFLALFSPFKSFNAVLVSGIALLPFKIQLITKNKFILIIILSKKKKSKRILVQTTDPDQNTIDI
jgi:hypothetical protein